MLKILVPFKKYINTVDGKLYGPNAGVRIYNSYSRAEVSCFDLEDNVIWVHPKTGPGYTVTLNKTNLSRLEVFKQVKKAK